jgi:CBS-domain-containing membrane protein
MKKISQNQNICTSHPLEISDDDIIEAMKDIQGYLDITPGDFKVLYRLAYKHAIERLSQLIKACDVMTERVISVKRDTPSEEVAYTMATHGISGVPVVESENKVIGVISEKDFLFHMGSRDTTSFMEVVAHCLSNKEFVAISMRRQKAEQIMTSPAITVRKDVSVSKIAILFIEKNINRVPVTDREGKLLGIVARADIVQSSYIPVIKTDDEK